MKNQHLLTSTWTKRHVPHKGSRASAGELHLQAYLCWCILQTRASGERGLAGERTQTEVTSPEPGRLVVKTRQVPG